MTTPPTPFSDEELSAAIDGELDADRLAALEADDDARRRRDELAAVSARIAAPVDALDPTTVDDLIASALDAPLAPAAPRRPGRSGSQPWLVAAVVVVLLAVGLGLIWSGRDTAKEDASSSSGANDGAALAHDRAADGAGDASAMESGAAPEASEGGAPTTTAPSLLPAPIPLGSFASGDDLRAALAESFPTAELPAGSTTVDEGTAKLPTGALDRCAEQLRVTLDLDASPTATGTATVDDRPVLVYEFAADGFDDGQPTTLVAAVGQDACDQVVIFQR